MRSLVTEPFDIDSRRILVGDLIARRSQLERRLGLLYRPFPDAERLRVIDAMVAPAHVLHHRAFELRRLDHLLEAIKLGGAPRFPSEAGWENFADTDIVMRGQVFPKEISPSQLQALPSALERHADEFMHARLVLVNAAADAAWELDAGNGRGVADALRGASALSTAGVCQQQACIDAPSEEHAEERAACARN